MGNPKNCGVAYRLCARNINARPLRQDYWSIRFAIHRGPDIIVKIVEITVHF